jgi:hypothetical protein
MDRTVDKIIDASNRTTISMLYCGGYLVMPAVTMPLPGMGSRRDASEEPQRSPLASYSLSRHSTGRPIVSARPIGSAIVRSIRNTDQRCPRDCRTLGLRA